MRSLHRTEALRGGPPSCTTRSACRTPTSGTDGHDLPVFATGSPSYGEVLGCLHVVLDEEWQHHRDAARDLDALSRG